MLRVKAANPTWPPLESIKISLLTLNSIFLFCQCHAYSHLYHFILLFLTAHSCMVISFLYMFLLEIICVCIMQDLIFMVEDLFISRCTSLFPFTLLAWILTIECTHTFLENVDLKKSIFYLKIDQYLLSSRNQIVDVGLYLSNLPLFSPCFTLYIINCRLEHLLYLFILLNYCIQHAIITAGK